jgi:hypothetical protein
MTMPSQVEVGTSSTVRFLFSFSLSMDSSGRFHTRSTLPDSIAETRAAFSGMMRKTTPSSFGSPFS